LTQFCLILKVVCVHTLGEVGSFWHTLFSFMQFISILD